MTKKKWLILVATLGLATTVGGAGYALWHQYYLEAVAITCIVPVLTWFATGAGKGGE